MNPVERWLRERLNPWSTAATVRWHGGWHQSGARKVGFTAPRPEGASSGSYFVALQKSPGDWKVPAGKRPGWSWLPPGGARPNIREMPLWVRVWHMMPLLDRFAYEWMWWHGLWLVVADWHPPPPDAQVREPRQPQSPRPAADVRLEPPE